MQVDQLPAEIREFAQYLEGLSALLDQGGGWCGVFWQRDPDGMRACLEGREVPPWDVVQALLQDLAARHGAEFADRESARAAELHAASAAARDALPDGRHALRQRLELMLREQRAAAERQAGLGDRLRLASNGHEAEQLGIELAWARDDHERATARCAELRARLAALGPAEPKVPRQGGWFRDEAAPGTGPAGPGAPAARGTGDFDPWARTPNRGGAVAPGGPSGRPHSGTPLDGRPAGGPAGYAATAAGAAHHEPAGDGTGEATPGAAAAGHGMPGGPAGSSGHPREVPHHVMRDVTRGTDADTGHVPDDGAAASAPAGPEPGQASGPVSVQTGGPASGAFPGYEGHGEAPSKPAKKKRKPRGARYAWLEEAEEDTPAAVVPVVDVLPEATPDSPRGARFAGAAKEKPGDQKRGVPGPRPEEVSGEARRVTAGTVGELLRLRSEGRGGEAHVVLCEAAGWPPDLLPLLAAELHRVGLGADWATLLWEVASQPPERLAAAAAALSAAGREQDCHQLLRQGVSRPAPEIAEALLALDEAGRGEEAQALLDAHIRVRTPEETARIAQYDPRRLTPLLLRAARSVSDERHWDLAHALRVAGISA
ncbi:hypothetical protein [Streptomyces sp. GC420]|uniref:hypothetical protein n=1 Tax=Streptomyces sp. GC420 TaxID=2697568 RepID=UPI001414F26E|nr:hypothetical protein [Streptomyces sp. GC420]NBM19135.1 hypothetical protein [Streptomyces sp. GC420]